MYIVCSVPFSRTINENLVVNERDRAPIKVGSKTQDCSCFANVVFFDFFFFFHLGSPFASAPRLYNNVLLGVKKLFYRS